VGPGDSLTLASGYFNLPDRYASALLSHSPAVCARSFASPTCPVQDSARTQGRGAVLQVPNRLTKVPELSPTERTAVCVPRVVTAAPEANGFFNSAGPSGALPQGYTEKLKRFLARVGAAQSPRIPAVEAFEWARPGWTFHAKGLWWQRPDGVVSLVGSPNFGVRSLERDLELSVAVVSRDKTLALRLQQEQQRLLDHARPTTLESLEADPSRRIERRWTWARGPWLHFAHRFFGPYM
jgi:phosphatidylserine/phosphatidylglycerophosphate/cardiolipin synthase-like enzyme